MATVMPTRQAGIPVHQTCMQALQSWCMANPPGDGTNTYQRAVRASWMMDTQARSDLNLNH